MEEIWKDVVGFEGYYQVSNLGRVKRIKGGRGSNIGKILQGAPATDGYWRVLLRKNSKSKCVNVHILVAKAFIPNPDNKSEVNHVDGDKLNNSCSNLEWVTHQENMNHAWRTGLCHFHSEETRKRISEAQKGRQVSKESCRKMSESHKGRVYVNDGIKNRMIKPTELQDYLNMGYVQGLLKKEK